VLGRGLHPAVAGLMRPCPQAAQGSAMTGAPCASARDQAQVTQMCLVELYAVEDDGGVCLVDDQSAGVVPGVHVDTDFLGSAHRGDDRRVRRPQRYRRVATGQGRRPLATRWDGAEATSCCDPTERTVDARFTVRAHAAVALWPSNTAIISTMSRPEEVGIHVHAWDYAGALVIDETHSPSSSTA